MKAVVRFPVRSVAAGMAPSVIRSSLVRCMPVRHVQSVVQYEASCFDPNIPVEKASTPPSRWYTQPYFLNIEKSAVFKKNWIMVGRTSQLKNPGDYFTRKLLNEPLMVVMDENRKLQAFFNVCKHHGTRLVDNEGHVDQFVCPYHGWTYSLDGRLRKATRLKGIQDFKAASIGLDAIAVDTLGPFIYINFDGRPVPKMPSEQARVPPVPAVALKDALGESHEVLQKTNYEQLQFVKSISYKMKCNWKVYIDNYLDGGYHVPFAHKGLSEGLNLKEYETKLYKNMSVQSAPAAPDAPSSSSSDQPQRVSGTAVYVYEYPNFVINRYGPWMDTNLVWPTSANECEVIFDYYLDPKYVDNKQFIQSSLAASDVVQQEDTYLCESVQSGLESSVYDTGRYAPSVEFAMHHFHQRLHKDIAAADPTVV